MRTRTVDEVVEMAKHGLAAGKGQPKHDSFTILKKHQANVVIKSEATTRDEAFTDVEVNRSGMVATCTISCSTLEFDSEQCASTWCLCCQAGCALMPRLVYCDILFDYLHPEFLCAHVFDPKYNRQL